MSARPERNIHREIAGQELSILQGLGIHPQGRAHMHCPFPDHEDLRPSWRWDSSKVRFFCTCGSGSIVDVVMRTMGLDARESILWIRRFLDGGQAPRQRAARPAPPPLPSNDNVERQKQRLQEAVAALAVEAWVRARPARADHPYLKAKGVGPHELRQQGGMLYVPMFDIDGRLWNLQMISQADEGKFKKLFLRDGRAGGLFSPIGLAGVPERLLVCEGWSTGATLREKAGQTMMCAMSDNNLMAVARAAREAWPEADIIIAADNDRRTRGNPGLTKGTLAAIAVGARLAVPEFPEGARPKDSDFNDLERLKPGAVKAAIDAAERPKPPASPARRAFMSAEAASQALKAAVEEFFKIALRPPTLDVPGVLDLNTYDRFHAIRASAGLGKTDVVLDRLTDPALPGLHIDYAVPTVELAHELKGRYDAKAQPGSPRMLVILGREQVRPDGVRMCKKHRTAEAVARTGVSVQRTLCRRELKGEEARRHGSNVELCPHFHECPYQKQIQDKEPAIRVQPHARLFLPGKKDEARTPDIVVIDEAFHNTALRGTLKLREDDEAREGRGGYYIVVDRMAGEGRGVMSVPRRDGKGEDFDATADLDAISAKCARALYRGGKLADFIGEGVTEEDAGAAVDLAFRCVEPLGVTPAMAEPIQDEKIKNYKAQEALRIGRFFKLLKKALAAGIDPRTFELLRGVPNGDKRLEDRCYMRWSADLKIGEAGVLMIDADLDETVARRFVPKLARVTEIDAQPQNYRGTQITDRRVSMDMLSVSLDARKRIAEHGIIPAKLSEKDRTRVRNVKRLHRLAEVKAAGGRRGLIVSYKAAEEVLRVLPSIEGVEFAHFSALRGVDRWKDVDFVIVAGAPQVNEGDLERTAEALWYLSPEPIKRIEPDANGKRAYTKEPRRIEMADGSSAVVSVDRHSDEKCARLLDLIRREVGQALARARLIHRRPDKPCEIILLTNVPTELPVHATTTWENATNVNLLDLMAARGMIPETWRDVATLLADVIEADSGEPGDAARKAFERAGLPNPADLVTARLPDERLYKNYYRRSSGSQPFQFRVKGRRQSARILIDLTKHPDPKAALEKVFGELDKLEAVASGHVGEEGIGVAAAPLAAPVPAPPAEAATLEAAGLQPPPSTVAETEDISDLVAPEPVTFGFVGFGHEDPDYGERDNWPGPDPDAMPRQASLPRLVVANPPPEPPGELSDGELIRLLPPKRPTDTAVAWECRAHDVLRANRVEWFRAQKMVKRESAAHNWRAHCPVRLAPARDSP